MPSTEQSGLAQRIVLLCLAALAGGCSQELRTGPDPDFARAGGGTVTVSGADPDTVMIDTTLTVRILGSGFTAGSKVEYAIAGTVSSKVTAPRVTFVSSSELQTTTVVAADAPLASYDIIVTTATGKRGVGVERFLVQARLVMLPEAGGVSSGASDVNDAGVIVGTTWDASGRGSAMRWTPQGEAWVAEVLGGGYAWRINLGGDLLRYVHDGSRPQTWVRLASGLEVDLGYGAYGADIADDGTVAGRWTDLTGSRDVVWHRTGPATWSGPVTLPSLAGYTNGGLNGISSNGQWIAGRLENIATGWEWAALWKRVNDTWTGPFLVINQASHAMAVNNTGAIGGGVWPCTDYTCGSVGTYWSGTGMTGVSLASDQRAYVWDVNNAGAVGGYANLRTGAQRRGSYLQRPVIWFPATAAPLDLGTGNGLKTGEVRALNNRGMAVGSLRDTRQHATVWVLP